MRRTHAAPFVLLMVAMAACRSPSWGEGVLLCAASGKPCPDGYACVAGACYREGGDFALPSPTDAGMPDLSSDPPDAAEPPDAADTCAWSFLPENVGDPCAIAAPEQPWEITSNKTYDPATAASPRAFMVSQGSSGKVWVVHVDGLVVESGITLTVNGSLPLVILARGDVAIRGTINVRNSPGAVCASAVSPPPFGALCGAGFGGGGFGGRGGDSGGCSDGNTFIGSEPGGGVVGDPSLVPLRGGCPGGGKYGGEGGGALQISADGTIAVSGRITAPGRKGQADPSGGGGAGGGAGGGILLEARSVSISGSLCAMGAGGAGGSNGSITTAAGADGRCNNTVAPGGGGVGPGGEGGNGNGLMPGALDGQRGGSGRPELSSDAPTWGSGGGGGGGAGRIRLVGRAGTPFIAPDALVLPAGIVK